MNDPMIIAGAIVMVLGGFGAVIVQIINAKAAADERREAKISRIVLEKAAVVNDVKNNEIIKQGVSIHTLTNSNLSKVTSDLGTALSKIESLEKLITRLDKENNHKDADVATPIIPLPIPITIVDEKDKL